MMMAAVAERARTQPTTSSMIQVIETEEQFNTECQKVLASRSDRRGTFADMDACRATELKTDPEDCDGWTQQVVVWNKKCCGAKSGHLGHLFESQKVSERQIKELANIEKLEVAGNHVAGDQSSNNRNRPRQVAGRCGERNARRSNCDQKQ